MRTSALADRSVSPSMAATLSLTMKCTSCSMPQNRTISARMMSATTSPTTFPTSVPRLFVPVSAEAPPREDLLPGMLLRGGGEVEGGCMLLPLFNSEWGALSRPLMHDSEVDYDPDVPIEPEERPVMSIFGDIMSAIFGSSAKAGTPAASTEAPAAKRAAGSPAGSPSATHAPSVPTAPAATSAATVDVAAVLDALAKKN